VETWRLRIASRPPRSDIHLSRSNELEFLMRPVPPKYPAANVRWALDVLSLRKLFSEDPRDSLNRAQIFAVDDVTTMTDEELVALHHLGRLTSEGVREFAAERNSLTLCFASRKAAPLRPIPVSVPKQRTKRAKWLPRR
jgi:hypothetical protein